MPRVVSIWLPAWPIERLERSSPGAVPADRPFALVDTGARGLVLHAANRAALAAGVRVGETLADMRAVLPSLAARPAELTRDAAALQRLARWLGHYGPARNVDGLDGAWVDVTGAAHLAGGEAALAADLAQRLAGNGFTARVGLADSHRAAWALARYEASSAGSGAIAPAGGTRAALAALPVAALGLASDTLDLLRRLGLKRIGDLYGIPRPALARRFRDDAPSGSRRRDHGRHDAAATAVLLRLDQALGITADPRRPMEEPPAAEVRLPCPEPLLTAAGIEAALDELAVRLVAGLAASGLGARAFRLILYRADGTTAEARTATSAACREAGHIRRLLGERLTSLDAGFGVDLVTLAADRLEKLVPETATLAGARQARADGDAGRLVDRLAGRLGSDRVSRLGQGVSHVPERAQVRSEALAGALPPPAAPLPVTGTRPAFLLEPPEPAEVVAEVPDGAPARLDWRRVGRRIVRAEGPERIAPEWWLSLALPAAARARTRDYWQLEDDTGAGYWVFREGLWEGEGAKAEPGEATAAGDTEDSAVDEDAAAGPEPEAPRWFVHGVFA